MIEVRNLVKQFDNQMAVNDISFTVAEGETLVLLGTSGCGKTTTLRMINRLVEPSSGDIFINGENILNQPPTALRRSIGYVLQNNGLFPHYTIAENIAVVPNLLQWPKEKITERTAVLMDKLQLPAEYLPLYPSALSGGQQQRVGFARALAANPPVLLMDEPFGALDPITKTNIRKEFSHIDELKSKTVIMVTHDVQEAFEMGNRICLMHKGKIEQIGAPSDLLFNPVNDFVASFLSAQKLQLSLSSTKLAHVLEELQPYNKEVITSIPSSFDLWEAMEWLNNKGEEVVAVENILPNKVKEYKLLQLNEILPLLNKLQKRN